MILSSSCTVKDKWSRVSTESSLVGGQLAVQNVLHDEHQIELIGIQNFNNVKMSGICDKNIYFMYGNCLHTTYFSTWMQWIQQPFFHFCVSHLVNIAMIANGRGGL